MDSGASSHIDIDVTMFVSYKKLDKPMCIRVGNDEIINTEGPFPLEKEPLKLKRSTGTRGLLDRR